MKPINYILNGIIFEVIVSPASISVLCCFTIYFLYKASMKEIRKYFIISFMTGVVLATGSYILILPLLSIITIIQLKNYKDEMKIKILLTIYVIHFMILIISNYIHIFSGENLHVFIIEAKYKLIAIMITSIIAVIIYGVKELTILKKRVKKQVSSSQIRLRMILSISIPLTILIYMIFQLQYLGNEKTEYIMGNFIPQGLPLISIILINIIVYNYDRAVENEVKLKRQIQEKQEIEEYSHIIESMYGETRRFKHDYMNMIISLKEFIDNKDINELKEFFYNNIIDMDKDIKWSNSNIDKLRYVKLTALKAALSTKLIKALSMSIDIKVDILEPIEQVPINIMDLCRIVGILMDNAIEAAVECEYPRLSICIVEKQDYVVIIVQNNFLGLKPLIHKIYKEGFSTRGSNRGLGLYIVKNIIDKKYNNVFINTSIEENLFIQELWIKRIERIP